MRSRTDVIFLSVLLIISLSVFFGYKLTRINSFANTIIVSINGEETIYEIEPGVEKEYIFTGKDDFGKSFENVMRINDDGSVQMESADCPDKTCVRQGKIRHNNETIVCLPHRIIIRMKNNDNKIDTVAK